MSPENKDQELSFEQGSRNRLPVLVAYAVMIVATTGYFIGVTAPMISSEPVQPATQNSVHSQAENAPPDDAIVLPATTYRGMTTARKSPNHDWTTSLASLKQTTYDPFANIVLNQNDKLHRCHGVNNGELSMEHRPPFLTQLTSTLREVVWLATAKDSAASQSERPKCRTRSTQAALSVTSSRKQDSRQRLWSFRIHLTV